MRYPLLALFVAMLALAPAADGAAVKVKPVYAVKSASVSGKKVKFVLTVTLPAPVKCPKKTDKVTASYSASGKKIWEGSGGYTLDSDVCLAVIHGKLPKAKYNKSLKFKFKFPGNKNVKKFSGGKTLKLVTPPPAAPPANDPGGIPATHGPQSPGPWFISNADDSGDSGFSFTLGTDYKVPAIMRANALTMNCVSGGVTQVPFSWSNTFFGMGAQLGTVTSGSDNPNTSGMTYSLNYNFTGAHTGTGVFSASGPFKTGPSTFDSCSLSFNVTLSGGN